MGTECWQGDSKSFTSKTFLRRRPPRKAQAKKSEELLKGMIGARPRLSKETPPVKFRLSRRKLIFRLKICWALSHAYWKSKGSIRIAQEATP